MGRHTNLQVMPNMGKSLYQEHYRPKHAKVRTWEPARDVWSGNRDTDKNWSK